ncbi:hypothetical protein JCM3765_005518 [Sporobolomyces pararoseus]
MRPRFSSTSSDSPPPPPKGSVFSASAIYPFLLLSAITSLALNLSHQRTAKSQETAHLSAQITVLESLLNQLRSPSGSTPPSSEEIERELELVGLGRGKGKTALGEGDGSGKSRTSWSEVLFGKKGKEFEQDKDDTDWEKVFREADEAENKKKTSTSSPSSPSDPATVPTPVLATPPPAPSPTPASKPLSDQTPPKPKSTAIYL